MRLFKSLQWGVQIPDSIEVLRLKVRSDLHLARKAYHVFGVLLIVGLYQVLNREQGVLAIAIATPLIVLMDFLRLNIPKLNRIIFNTFGAFLRQEEARRMSGMSHLLVGALLVITLFPKSVGLLAFLFLAFGDPFASTIGVLYGKDKILPNKSLQGTIAAFAICTLTSFLYFYFTGILSERWLLASLVAGVVGAIGELLPFGKLDDNFTIPVFSAIMLYGMFYFFGGL